MGDGAAASVRLAFLLNLLLVCLFWISHLRAPEVGCVLVVCKGLSPSHFDHLLGAICCRDQGALNRSVFILSLTTIQVPSVSNHQLEVVILVDARADIRVVVDEFSLGNFSIAHVCVPLCDEFVEDVIFGHLTALELRVEAHIVLLYNVGKINDSTMIAVELLVGQLNQTNTALGKFSTEATKELVVADPTVVVFVKELEDAFKLRRAK